MHPGQSVTLRMADGEADAEIRALREKTE